MDFSGNYTLLISSTPILALFPAEYYHNQSFSTHIESPFLSGNPLLELYNERCDSYHFALTLMFMAAHWKQIVGIKMPTIDNKMTTLLFFIIRKSLKTVVGGFMTLLLFFLTAPFYFLLLTIKSLVMCFVFWCEGNAVKFPKGHDALWSTTTELRKPFISAFLKFEGKPDLGFIRDSFREKVLSRRLPNGELQFRKLQQVYVMSHGYHIWKDVAKFDIRSHIMQVDMKNMLQKFDVTLKHDSECSEEVICRFLSDYGLRGISGHLPQWEILLFTGNDDNGFSAIIRLHHAIGDGMAIMRLMLEILADSPVKVALLGPPQRPLAKLLSTLWSIFLIPFGLKLVLSRGRENPLHGKELTGRKIFVTSKPIPLDMIKNIKKKTKTSVSAVLFSCLSSSLASFYEKRCCEVSDINLVVPLGFEDLSSPVKLENTLAIGFVKLPTPSNVQLKREMNGLKNRRTSLTRLSKIKESFDILKDDPTVMSLYWITALVSLVLPTSVSESLFSSKGNTMGVSNMPGPEEEIYMWNRKVLEMRFWVPDRSPTGAGFTIMSYKGQVHVSFSVDKALISTQEEAEEIINKFKVALDELMTDVEDASLRNSTNEKELLLSEVV